MPKKVVVGRVTSAKMKKTRVVEIPWSVKHPKYGKYLRRRTICYVHDEQDASALGDSVEIRESRPRSKTKRWELVRVVTAAKNKGATVIDETGAEVPAETGAAEPAATT